MVITTAHESAREQQLRSYIEASSTTTTALSARYASDLELTANELHCVVYAAALEQLQTRLVHHDSCSELTSSVFILKDCIVRLVYIRCLDQLHKVLEAMTSTRLDADPQRQLWVVVFLCDRLQTMLCSLRDRDVHVVAVIVLSRVLGCSCVPRCCC